MTKIIIRILEKNDIPQVVELNINSWKKTYKDIIEESFLNKLNINEEIERQENNFNQNKINNFK